VGWIGRVWRIFHKQEEITASQLLRLARVDVKGEDRIHEVYDWYHERATNTARGAFAFAALLAGSLLTLVGKLPFGGQQAGAALATSLVLIAVMALSSTLGLYLLSRVQPVSREYVDALYHYARWRQVLTKIPPAIKVPVKR
jgi:hypothetical protein